MEPIVRPDFYPIEYNGKKLLAVEIHEILQNKKPCYYKPKGLAKGSYTRVGDRDEVMTDYEIYALQSYNDGIREDLRPNKRATIEDLDREDLDKYIKKVKEEKPNFSKNNEEKILKLCGITDNNEGNIYPTLAGTMIFGEYPQSHYPQLFIACAVIPGKELGEVGEIGQRFDDNKRIEGTIEQMLEGALVFLRKNMKTKVIIDNKTIAQYKEMVIEFCKEPKTAKEISLYLGLTSRSYISSKIIKPLINEGILEYTNKKSANASNQRYIKKQ